MSSAYPVELSAKMETSDRTTLILTRLLSISKSTRALLYLKLSQIDFHNGQDELLVSLNPGEALGVIEVARRLNVRPSTISKMLDRLVQKDLIDRMDDKFDSRRKLVRLTPGGIAAREAIGRLRRALESELFDRLGRDDLRSVVHALDLVDETLRSKLARLR